MTTGTTQTSSRAATVAAAAEEMSVSLAQVAATAEQAANNVTVDLAQFQFHLPPATSFLRLHQPQKFGDDLSSIRATVVQANREGKPVMGIETGVEGIGLRGVAPVFFQGHHVGSVEFGGALDQSMLMKLKEKFGVDLAVLVPTEDKWRTLAATRTDLFPLNPAFLNKIISTGQTAMDQVTAGGRDYLDYFGVLKDFSGKNIGVMAFKTDISTDLAELHHELYVYTGLGLAACAGPAVFPDGQTGGPEAAGGLPDFPADGEGRQSQPQSAHAPGERGYSFPICWG